MSKQKFVDVVGGVPIVGWLSAAILNAILRSPMIIVTLASIGYLLVDYANIEGIAFLSSLSKGKNASYAISCVLSERSASAAKIIPCVEKLNAQSPAQDQNFNPEQELGKELDKNKDIIDRATETFKGKKS